MTKEHRKKFTGEWMKMGFILAKKAERLGLDPLAVGVWNLQNHVQFMDNLGEPIGAKAHENA